MNLSLVAMIYWFQTIRYTRGALKASLSPESIKMDHVLSPIFSLNLKVLLGPCSAFFLGTSIYDESNLSNIYKYITPSNTPFLSKAKTNQM